MIPPKRLRLGDGRVIQLPAVMGILNVTPDSFSDGGQYLEPARALEHALAMEAEGAAIIDVGGESSRPHGARAITAAEELERVVPVLRLLGRHLRVPISIDTRKASVARQALDLGAAMVNDTSEMTADPEMIATVAAARCAVVLMHMRGGLEDHVKWAHYSDVVAEVRRYLQGRVAAAVAGGVAAKRIVLDPGIGFAKTARHNLALLHNLKRLVKLGFPLLVGASRKRFVRELAGSDPCMVEWGNAGVNAAAILSGAAIVRVHAVAPAVAVVKLAAAIRDNCI